MKFRAGASFRAVKFRAGEISGEQASERKIEGLPPLQLVKHVDNKPPKSNEEFSKMLGLSIPSLKRRVSNRCQITSFAQGKTNNVYYDDRISNMNIHNTPTKTVKVRGRPLKPPSSSDNCRICKANFKITLGNFSRYIPTENIYASKKSNAEGFSLSDLITKTLRIPVDKDKNLSSRVCSKCALKMRNAAKLTNVVQSSINVPHTDFCPSVAKASKDGLHVNVQFKRLPNSPGLAQSPCRKKAKLHRSPTGKPSKASTSMTVADNRGLTKTPRRSLHLLLNESTDCDKENEDPMLPFAMGGGDISELSDNNTEKELK